VTDSYSRYLPGCRALLSTETEGADATFLHLFKKYGLPQAIRSDFGHGERLREAVNLFLAGRKKSAILHSD